MLRVTEADGVLLDLRYATADNLTGAPIYTRPVALLRPEAHALLLAAVRRAAVLGLQVKLFDAFRPVEAQWALWRALPDPRFVADPAAGQGLHPRGVAVDVTLVDRATGAELDMGTGFDDMTARSAQGALDLPAAVIRNRALLLGTMAAVGWEHIASEWWHYQVRGWMGCRRWGRGRVGWTDVGAHYRPSGADIQRRPLPAASRQSPSSARQARAP